MTALKSPARISRGIRSSYELERLIGHEPHATVREIPPPTYCVVSKRGVLRAVYERIEPQ